MQLLQLFLSETDRSKQDLIGYATSVSTDLFPKETIAAEAAAAAIARD